LYDFKSDKKAVVSLLHFNKRPFSRISLNC
jgi:hypothetical protein